MEIDLQNTWGVGKDAVQRKKKKTLAFGKYRGTGSCVLISEALFLISAAVVLPLDMALSLCSCFRA